MKTAAQKGKKLVVADNVASSSSGTEISLGGSGMDNQGVEKCVAQESMVANSVTENLTIPMQVPVLNQEEGCDSQLNAESQANPVEEVQLVGPIKAVVNNAKGKKKRKTIEDILGFSKVNTQSNKGRKNKHKCVVFRSAVTAAALSASISSEGIVNRNRIILNEAQAIWECNKIIGVGYDGEEEEVISKIAEMVA